MAQQGPADLASACTLAGAHMAGTASSKPFPLWQPQNPSVPGWKTTHSGWKTTYLVGKQPFLVGPQVGPRWNPLGTPLEPHWTLE